MVFAAVLLAALPARAETEPGSGTESSAPQDGAPPTPAEIEPVITGVNLLTQAAVRQAAGPAPSNGRPGPWAEGAIKRILHLYHTRGYIYARAWYRASPDDLLRIDIDEGRMAGIVFLDASVEESFVFRMAITLPGDVYHKPMIDDAMKRLLQNNKDTLVDLSYNVVDRSELVTNILGDIVPARELQIKLVHKRRLGWMIEANLNSTYGLVPGVRFLAEGMIAKDDRFYTWLDVAVPYRRLLSEPDPKFTWVHGLLGLHYQLPALVDGLLVPGVETEAELSYYARTDIGFASLRSGRWLGVGELGFYILPPLLELVVGVGATNTYVFNVARLPPDPTGQPTITPGERSLQRYLVRTSLILDMDSEEKLRTARKRTLRIEETLSFSQSARLLSDSRVAFQYPFQFGLHDLILRARGLYLAGDVLFWDEQPLSGPSMRAFFGDRYWVRETVQAEIAFRGAVYRDKVKLGVFNDIAGFRDASRPGRPFAGADAFGPSVHFVFLDQFSLDLYYAFGFAPMGFSHNFSLSLQSVF
ncbi:MAG: hypothetical protein C4523_13040 [Myxococcales bacterium]|nr:MAG: hypothetical protein C4523_13040 [Myxococcales bacterium]